jgi:hypothetical protein
VQQSQGEGLWDTQVQLVSSVQSPTEGKPKDAARDNEQREGGKHWSFSMMVVSIIDA